MKREIKESGYDAGKMAEKFGITRAKMSYYIYRLGLHVRPKLRYHSDQELIVMCAHVGSAREFLRQHNISRSKLKSVFDERGLDWPYVKKRTLDSVKPSVVERMYREAGYNWRIVADSFGVCFTTMYRYAKDNGIKSHRGITVYPWDVKQLEYLYVELGFGTKTIAKALQKLWGTSGPTDVTVKFALRRFGFKLRGVMESAKARPRLRDKSGRTVKQPIPEIPDHLIEKMSDEAWLAEPGREAASANGKGVPRRV